MKTLNLLLIGLLVAQLSQAQVTGGSVQASQEAQMAAQTQEVATVPVQAPAPAQTQVVNKVVNYGDQPLNISGDVVEEEVITDGELEYINEELGKQKKNHKLNKKKVKGYKKLKQTTEKLVDSTEEYVEERKSSEAMIKDYNKKIKCLLDENNTSKDCEETDEVKVQQAAPAPQPEPAPVQQIVVVEEKEEVQPEPDFIDKLKILPGLGFSNYNGNNISNITSNVAISIDVESEIWNRFAIGFGLNYQTVDFTDFFNQQYGAYGLNPYFNNNFGFYNNYYNNFGGWGRDIQMTSIGVDLYGKFYVFSNTRVRPYIGGGLGYKRINLEYQSNNPYQIGNFQFGNESFSSNLITGEISVGTEFSFSEQVSIFAEISYARGISTFGQSNTNFLLPDEMRLRQLNDDFAEAGSLSINGGVGISF